MQVPIGGGAMLTTQGSAGTLETLASSRRGISGLDETGGGMYEALNMPQALNDLGMQGQGHATYAFRQPSMERSNLQPSPIGSGSPTSSRGLYAFRQLSPSAPQTARNHTSSGTYNQRTMSPGPHRTQSMQAPPGAGMPHGQMSPRRQQTPGRALNPNALNQTVQLPDHRIQRITSAPPPNASNSVLNQSSKSSIQRRVSAVPGQMGSPGPVGVVPAMPSLGSAQVPISLGSAQVPIAVPPSPIPGSVGPALSARPSFSPL